MKELEYINSHLNKKAVERPKMLYKYRPFDEHTFDMLENEYIFLCKAKDLDDPSECKTTFVIEDFYDVKTGRISYRVVDGILEYLAPYASKDDFKQIRGLVFRTMRRDGSIDRRLLLESAFEMEELAPNVDLAPIVNFLANIPERFAEPEMRKRIEVLLLLAMQAREKMGICSLTELADSPEMWKNYADNSTGYCLQYSMDEYDDKQSLFPVVYSDKRDTEILPAIISSFLGFFIVAMSYGRIPADQSQFFRLFLTKNMIWAYQKEWRIIGNANEKIKAPHIGTIYLGANISDLNRKAMERFCQKNKIVLK